MRWRRLATGKYNAVYINDDETDVFKVQLFDHKSDTPERSVRLWNLINSDVYPDRPAMIHRDQDLGDGWVCPFIRGDQALDDDVSAALLQIFNRTGRIILDALTRGNCLRTHDGQVVCVDVGMVVELERREALPRSLAPSSDGKALQALTRKKSETSLYIWDTLQGPYNRYFDCEYATTNYPKTASIIKALLFIKTKRPDISNVDFLIGKADLIALFVDAYSQSQLRVTIENELAIRNALQILDACSSAAPLLSSPPATEGGGSAGAGAGAGATEREEHAVSPSRHGLGLFSPVAATGHPATVSGKTTTLQFP